MSNLPAIPDPQLSLESLRETALALKEAVENFYGVRGPASTTLATADNLAEVSSAAENAASSAAAANNAVTSLGNTVNALQAELDALTVDVSPNTLVGNISDVKAKAVAVPTSSVFDDQLGNTVGSIAVRNATTWRGLAAGATGNILQSAGPGRVPVWAPLPTQWTRVVKQVNQNVTGNTNLINDTHLVFPIAANRTYACRIVAYVKGAPTSGTYQFTFSGPAGKVALLYGSPSGVAGQEYNIKGTSWAGVRVMDIFFLVQNGATAGSVALRWKVDVASTILTVLKGSYLEWAQVA